MVPEARLTLRLSNAEETPTSVPSQQKGVTGLKRLISKRHDKLMFRNGGKESKCYAEVYLVDYAKIMLDPTNPSTVPGKFYTPSPLRHPWQDKFHILFCQRRMSRSRPVRFVTFSCSFMLMQSISLISVKKRKATKSYSLYVVRLR